MSLLTPEYLLRSYDREGGKMDRLVFVGPDGNDRPVWGESAEQLWQKLTACADPEAAQAVLCDWFQDQDASIQRTTERLGLAYLL